MFWSAFTSSPGETRISRMVASAMDSPSWGIWMGKRGMGGGGEDR